MSFETKDRLMQAIVAATLIVSIILLWLAFAGYRAEAATLCAESSGAVSGAQHWMWREIDGRRCYYQGDRLLPKSELRWEHDVSDQSEHKLRHWERKNRLKLEKIDQTRADRTELPAAQSVPHILDVPTRSVPEGMGNSSNNGQAKPIDLMRGEQMLGEQMLGGVLIIPPYHKLER